MSWTKEQVIELVSPMIRKYDWDVSDINGGVKLTVTDGYKKASVNITGLEDIRTEAQRLIEAVDAHNYTDLDG